MSSGVGVERTFPIHSPKIAGITVVSKGKVRRAKLTFLKRNEWSIQNSKKEDKNKDHMSLFFYVYYEEI